MWLWSATCSDTHSTDSVPLSRVVAKFVRRCPRPISIEESDDTRTPKSRIIHSHFHAVRHVFRTLFRLPACQPGWRRICNECGFVLRLKPCEHCDAINDGAALQCHQCGAGFSETLPLAAPLASAAIESRAASDSSVVRALETIGADRRSMQSTGSADDSASRRSVPLKGPWVEVSDVGATRRPIIVERATEPKLLSAAQWDTMTSGRGSG